MSKQTEALKLALEASEVLEALFNQAEAMHEDMTAGVNVHCQITVADLSKGLYAAHAIREALAEQPAPQQDLPDFIAGALGVSRGTAYDLMREALAGAQQQEPVYWQWRRKDQPWSLEYTFNSEVQVTTKDSERRALYTSPPASKPWVSLTDWIDPNDKTQKQYLPHIGEPVLFCHSGKTYCGHHNGGSFQNQDEYFNTWECRWMYLPTAHGITGDK